jgi:hypothetical protein
MIFYRPRTPVRAGVVLLAQAAIAARARRPRTPRSWLPSRAGGEAQGAAVHSDLPDQGRALVDQSAASSNPARSPNAPTIAATVASARP